MYDTTSTAFPRYYHVGPDNPGSPPDADQFVWVVTHYTEDDYEGFGTAVGLSVDGGLYESCLGHCSCYGPLDGAMKVGMPMTPEVYLADMDEAVCAYPAVKKKVAELLGVVELVETP